MNQLIQQISAFKVRDNFPLEDWEGRGLNPSDEATRQGMNLAVIEFADFLISQISNGVVEHDVMLEQVQNYFDERDNYEFDTEEREYIVDVQCGLARLVKVDCSDLLI
ncbi:DUF4844 domain-containing protein [Hymenobacter negativus]|uniref:DUF4844 domain-containing protein n=1 Tax=Hymenobacter negativus TaxID=2795026 RepID=A0ABS3QAA6_9BACT|nr:DUF4844 domain-containing protein [Hymenobacter negativus]MBO2007645.1 DUF4844 domain-containing protein [Hymenobacter negativus]